MGYKLYASMGTGDYYMEHGIDVSNKEHFSLLLILFHATTFFNLQKEGKREKTSGTILFNLIN